METVFLIFKNIIFIDFQWKLFCLFSFLSKKSFVRKINANRKCFFKKEIGCREIALTLLFLELRVHILRCCRYGAEAHESGMYHFIFLSIGDPTIRSTGKIFAQYESKIKTIIILKWPPMEAAFSRDHVTYLSVWPAATSHYSEIIIRVVRVLAKSISKHPALVYSNHQVSNDISYVLLSLWVRLKVVTSQITHHRGRLVPMPPKRLKYLVYDPKQHKTAGKCHPISFLKKHFRFALIFRTNDFFVRK